MSLVAWCKADHLRGFTIAGDDRHFVPAAAVLDGHAVVVSSEQVDRPVAVRYNWVGAPDGNLYNGVGLPATPFRTDAWPRTASAAPKTRPAD